MQGGGKGVPLGDRMRNLDYRDGWNDMVVWLLGRLDVIPEARDAIHGLQAAHNRAMAAVPCSAGLADCHAPYYRHQPCCNLRVALWPGEEFPTDYLPDEGYIHLFEPADPACPNAPRKSAGCARLVGFDETEIEALKSHIDDGNAVGNCERCGDAFIRSGRGCWQRFCSAICRAKEWRARRKAT